MKIRTFSTAIFITLSIWSFAQPTGDIEKDTVLAKLYFEEALTLNTANDDNSNQIIVLLEKASELYEAHPFDERLIEVKGLLTAALWSNGLNQESEKLITNTFELANKHLERIAPSSMKYAYLAKSFMRKDQDSQQSISDGLKALKYLKVGVIHHFKLMESLISSSIYSRNFSQADSLINSVEQILTKQEEDALNEYWLIVYRGKMQYNMATGNYDNAIIYGQKFFIENDKYQQYKKESLAPIYIELGHAYSGLKQFDKAIKSMNKGLTITIEDIGDEEAVLGTYYSNIARMYGNKGDAQKAIANYEKAITYLLKDEIHNSVNLRASYSNLAAVYQYINDLEKAEQNIRKSQKYGRTYSSDLTLGNILGLQKKYEESLEVLQSALIQVCTNFKSTNPDDNPTLYEVYTDPNMASYIFHSKSAFLFHWGKETEDISLLKKSIVANKLALQLAQAELEASRGFERSQLYNTDGPLYYLNYSCNIYHKIFQIEPSEEIFNALFEVIEKKKSLQLINTLSPNTLSEPFYQKEKELTKAIQNTGFQLDLAMLRENEDSITHYQNELFEASQKIEKHFETVKLNYPEYTANSYNQKYATIEDVQKTMSENDVLIEYAYNFSMKINYVLVISSKHKSIQKFEGTNLKANIQKFNELIQDPFAFQNKVRDEFIDLSYELHNQLIKPIESELEGKSKLMIVIEGELFHLPFELLLATNEKKPYHELDFLIKKYAINYHYSTTTFLKLQEKETTKDHSLLAFAPVFSTGEELNEASRSLDFLIDSLYRGIDGNEFTALPNTKKEINSIAKIVKSNNGQANILLQNNATKDNFAQQLESQSYQFIHIATHGLVNFKNPRLSALACYSKDETMDNLMYANEIQFKNINADLVVLSSCESGIGQLVEGEGLIALNRSFIYSGAKNVMFSLWKVSDKYSSDLMVDFYENYFKGQSYTVALRNTKLEMLSNPVSAQPKFWSAFVLMGE